MHLLTQFPLGQRSGVILIMLIIVALGVWSWKNMPNELVPSVEATTIMVVTFMPGSNPDAMVDDVTEELEEVLASLEDVEKIESFSFDTKSLIFSTYYEGTDMYNAEDDAVAAVSGVDHPDEALEPIIELLDPALVPITWLTVTSVERPIPELQRITNDFIIPAIEKVEGTFLIDLFGAVDEEILVEVDLDKMEDLGVSLLQIGNALVSNNVNIPAGDIDQKGENIVIRTSTEFGSIEDVRNVVVTFEKNARDLLDFDRFGQVIPSVDLPNCEALANIQAIGVNCLDGEERKIRLKDIAQVKQGTAEAVAVTRNNGRPGLGISITKKKEASTVEVEAGVLAVLKDLEDVLPPDVEIVPLFSQVPSINAEIESLGSQGSQGFILAVIVVFVFLFNIRSGFRKGVFMAMRPTAVIAASIPISILAVFAI